MASRYKVKLHAFKWMSNHYHLVLTDSLGVLPDFMRDLNSLVSRALNAMRKTQGENFERSSYSMVLPADGDTILRHCAYSEANACKAHLVKRAREWTGATSAGMRFGQSKRVRRPNFGLWGEPKTKPKAKPKAKRKRIAGSNPQRAAYHGTSSAPDEVRLRLEAPPGFDGQSPAMIRRAINEQVEVIESEAIEERKAQGHKVLGMRAVSEMDYHACPRTRRELFTTDPKASAKKKEARLQMLARLRSFVSAYREALEEHKVTRDALFPWGTWKMRRHLNVRCAKGPP